MNPNEELREQYISRAEELVKEAKANDGLAPVDIEQFWKDQEAAGKDPFGEDIPQCALAIRMNHECVFDELGIEEDATRYKDNPDWALELRKQYNDRSEEIVGKRLLNENPPAETPQRWPGTKQLHHVFEAENVWHGGSWWLEQSADNPEELSALLDRVEKRNEDLRSFILPENWDEEKPRLKELGIPAPGYGHQRGPVTFAMSIYGSENLIFLMIDNKELAGRFRDLIIRTMTGIRDILDEEAGEKRKGFSFADDNCALLTPDMYEYFGAPVLQAMFDRYAPEPEDWRYQHSDSDMGHLLPILGRFNLQGCNFGPKLTVKEIRDHMPNTVIQGQLAPFTFSRNEEVNIVAEFLRDFDQAKETKGLNFTTAGSINNGSRLTGMRLIMAAIQKWGRY